MVPSIRVIHAVGGGNFHAVGGGSDSGNRDHGGEDIRFFLGFTLTGLVQFRSGCFRYQMEHVAVGVGAESYFGSSMFSPLVGVPATAAVRFASFQLLMPVWVADPDAKSVFLQIFAQNSPDLTRQGSSVASILMETSLGPLCFSAFGMLWVLPLCWSIG